MKRKSFGKQCAILLLLLLCLLSIFLTKQYIVSSYASMAENGLTGTPVPVGIFAVDAALWIGTLLFFVILDLVHALFHHENGFLKSFLGDLLTFVLWMLLYWPLLIPCTYLGALLAV